MNHTLAYLINILAVTCNLTEATYVKKSFHEFFLHDTPVGNAGG